MKLKLNEDKYIKQYVILGDFIDGYDCEVDDPENIEEWDQKYEAYYYDDENNELVFDENYYTQVILLKQENNYLRNRRQRECFPIINRGQMWFNMLTNEQKTELQNWYTAWLNVTETHIIPESPAWLELPELPK